VTWVTVPTRVLYNIQSGPRSEGTRSLPFRVFDNVAIYVNRMDASGIADRLWTVDLDTEAVAAFCERNPVTEYP
jgi:hypothetical protein